MGSPQEYGTVARKHLAESQTLHPGKRMRISTSTKVASKRMKTQACAWGEWSMGAEALELGLFPKLTVQERSKA